jgi:hypothetical protein
MCITTLAFFAIHHTPLISFGWTTILFDAVSLPDIPFQLTDFAIVSRFLVILCCSEDEHEENWDSSLYIIFNEDFGGKRFMDSHLKQSRQIMQSGTHEGKM